MRVAIGADHAGFELKEIIKQTLDELRVAYKDFGTDSDESVDYPDYAAKVGRAVAGGDDDLRLEPFEGADPGVVAHEDARRPQPIAEYRDDVRLQPLRRLRQRLHDEIVAVAIDDQRRQQIALAVDQPIGRRVDAQPLAEADGLIEAGAQEIGADDGPAGGEQPQRNL